MAKMAASTTFNSTLKDWKTCTELEQNSGTKNVTAPEEKSTHYSSLQRFLLHLDTEWTDLHVLWGFMSSYLINDPALVVTCKLSILCIL